MDAAQLISGGDGCSNFDPGVLDVDLVGTIIFMPLGSVSPSSSNSLCFYSTSILFVSSYNRLQLCPEVGAVLYMIVVNLNPKNDVICHSFLEFQYKCTM
jgi:hypothetical protein